MRTSAVTTPSARTTRQRQCPRRHTANTRPRPKAHLDAVERDRPGVIAVARTRPGFVLQADAGAAFARYGLPAYLPSRLLRHIPILPVTRRLVIPVVHATDVADAIVRILRRRSTGAFNLAADDPLHRDDIARVLGARSLEVPAAVVHGAVDITWRLRLQPLDASWIDLAFAAPLLDTTRARTILDWHPRVAADTALAETVEAMATGRGISSPVLRPRSAIDQCAVCFAKGRSRPGGYRSPANPERLQ